MSYKDKYLKYKKKYLELKKTKKNMKGGFFNWNQNKQNETGLPDTLSPLESEIEEKQQKLQLNHPGTRNQSRITKLDATTARQTDRIAGKTTGNYTGYQDHQTRLAASSK